MGSKDYTDWSSKGHEAGMKIWKERSPSTLLSAMISRINHPGRYKRLLIHLHPGIVFKPFINKPRSSKHKALRRRVHLEFQHLCGNSGIVIRNVYRMRFAARRLACFQQASGNSNHQCYQLGASWRNNWTAGEDNHYGIEFCRQRRWL